MYRDPELSELVIESSKKGKDSSRVMREPSITQFGLKAELELPGLKQLYCFGQVGI